MEGKFKRGLGGVERKKNQSKDGWLRRLGGGRSMKI